jgi:hypothetical protein
MQPPSGGAANVWTADRDSAFSASLSHRLPDKRCPRHLLTIQSIRIETHCTIFADIPVPMASHNSDNYKHTQLAHADSIRLLELLPGPRGSPLACNIFEARKHDNPEYEALSYAWGEPVFSHVVQEVSSGREIRVTINLEQALQAIRYEHAARILWADAICINQSDLKEKGHQVALMGEIYRDANRVVVWLGGPQIGSTRLLSVLHDLVEACKGRNWWESIDTVLDRMEVRESLRFLNQPW